jgi:hypothetical protein
MVTRKAEGIAGFAEFGDGDMGLVCRMEETRVGRSRFVTAHSNVFFHPAVLAGNLQVPDGGISN